MSATRMQRTFGRPRTAGRTGLAVLVALVLVLAAACSGGHHAAPGRSPRSVRAVPALDRDALGRVAATWLTRHHARGVVVGVQVGSHAPALAARGGVSADARVDIGRVAAAFVGAAAVRLADAGRLDLDATIDHWVPGFPHGATITVRDLLTHRSGIPPFADESGAPNPYTAASRAFLAAHRGRAPSAAEVLAFVAHRPLRSRPGTAVLYSDVNTVLAGMVVAGVTHTSLARALGTEVLEPWHLAATGPSGTAGGADLPVGALVSTSRDLLSFTTAYLRPALRGEHDLARSALAVGPGGTGLGVEGFTADGFCVFAAHGCPRGAPFVAVGAGAGGGGGDAVLVYDPVDDVAVVAVAPHGPGAAAGLDLADLVARARLLTQLGAARYEASVGYSARVPSTTAAR